MVVSSGPPRYRCTFDARLDAGADNAQGGLPVGQSLAGSTRTLVRRDGPLYGVAG